MVIEIVKNPSVEYSAQIATLINSSIIPADFMASDSPISEAQVEKMLESKTHDFYVARNDSSLLGYCLVQYKISPEFSHRVFVQSIVTHHTHRGCGVAQSLLQAVINDAKASNKVLVYLEVVSDNIAAIQLYQTYGMSEVGRLQKGFKKGDTFYDVSTYELIL